MGTLIKDKIYFKTERSGPNRIKGLIQQIDSTMIPASWYSNNILPWLWMSPLWLGYKRLTAILSSSPLPPLMVCFKKACWYVVRPTRQGTEGSLRLIVNEELTLSVQQQDEDLNSANHYISEFGSRSLTDMPWDDCQSSRQLTARQDPPKLHLDFWPPETER